VSRALEQARPRISYTRSPQSTPSIANTFRSALKKLTEQERDFLRNNKGCFRCRKTNVDHIAFNCPEKNGTIAKGSKEPVIKMETLDAIVDEFDPLDSYPSASSHASDTPHRTPRPIVMAAKIQGLPTQALMDSGASINAISLETVRRNALKTIPCAPVRIRQSLNQKGITANEKLLSQVQLPTKGWTSKKSHEFIVAPIHPHETILGTPFLASENLLINPAEHDVQCPTTESPKTPRWKPSVDPEDAVQFSRFILAEYSDVFADKLPNKPPHPKAPLHRIRLKDEHKSINGHAYRIPGMYLGKMHEFIIEQLAAGRIRPSSSYMSAGTMMVPKKDSHGTISAERRVVHDYRALNENTVPDHTPLPRQDEIMTASAKGKIRGKIDLVSAYYQLGMHPDDIHKTAFKTPFGMYEWLVMPQGLRNAPASFQRYMNYVLRNYIGRFCYVYLDDIIFWSNSVEEHTAHLRSILDALRDHGILASSGKSILYTDAVLFLGHIISSRGIEVADDKINKIISSHVPTSAQNVKEFNGLVNYIGQFIPGLAHWSTVLSELTKKNIEFKWEPRHQDALDKIKLLVRNTPVCKPIDYDSLDPIMVVADASNRAVGGYYGQGKDYTTMVPAGFHSRALNPAEKNYPTHDKEMLAIVDCLKKWEPQLTGTRFETLTDHAPLTHWKTQRDLSPRQVRWNETLTRFDTDICHIPGISNSAADALSRYPYAQAHELTSNYDPISAYIDATSIVEFDEVILASVRDHYKNDTFFGPVTLHPERYPLYEFKDGLILFEGRLAIPSNDRESRNTLLALHHDAQNHFGVSKTAHAINRDYFWPGISRDVENYIKSCVSCARNKSSTQAPAGFLHPMPIPNQRFTELAMDFVGPLPKVKGFDTILVMTDRLTNYVKIEPTTSSATAPAIADLVYRSWYRQFGLPTAITSDRDKLFVSKFWTELFKRLDVQLRMSTAYHPETDGSSERSNKTIIEALRHYVNVRQKDWPDHLIHVEAAMNNSVNATTSKTPTELLYGAPVRLFPTPIERDTITVPAVSEYIAKIEESVAIARDRHAEAKTRQAVNFNRHRRQEPEYKVGDHVYLDTDNIRLRIKQKGRSAKFYPRYVGPFEIISAKPSTSTYKLLLPPEYDFHPTFHAKRLKPALDNDDILFPNRALPTPPPVVDGSDEYEIERILDHRDTARGRQYLIHWLGYPDTDDEWIHEGHIEAQELVDQYLEGIRDTEM
jgi:hypothetical protein